MNRKKKRGIIGLVKSVASKVSGKKHHCNKKEKASANAANSSAGSVTTNTHQSSRAAPTPTESPAFLRPLPGTPATQASPASLMEFSARKSISIAQRSNSTTVTTTTSSTTPNNVPKPEPVAAKRNVSPYEKDVNDDDDDDDTKKAMMTPRNSPMNHDAISTAGPVDLDDTIQSEEDAYTGPVDLDVTISPDNSFVDASQENNDANNIQLLPSLMLQEEEEEEENEQEREDDDDDNLLPPSNYHHYQVSSILPSQKKLSSHLETDDVGWDNSNNNNNNDDDSGDDQGSTTESESVASSFKPETLQALFCPSPDCTASSTTSEVLSIISNGVRNQSGYGSNNSIGNDELDSNSDDDDVDRISSKLFHDEEDEDNGNGNGSNSENEQDQDERLLLLSNNDNNKSNSEVTYDLKNDTTKDKNDTYNCKINRKCWSNSSTDEDVYFSKEHSDGSVEFYKAIASLVRSPNAAETTLARATASALQNDSTDDPPGTSFTDNYDDDDDHFSIDDYDSNEGDKGKENVVAGEDEDDESDHFSIDDKAPPEEDGFAFTEGDDFTTPTKANLKGQQQCQAMDAFGFPAEEVQAEKNTQEVEGTANGADRWEGGTKLEEHTPAKTANGSSSDEDTTVKKVAFFDRDDSCIFNDSISSPPSTIAEAYSSSANSEQMSSDEYHGSEKEGDEEKQDTIIVPPSVPEESSSEPVSSCEALKKVPAVTPPIDLKQAKSPPTRRSVSSRVRNLAARFEANASPDTNMNSKASASIVNPGAGAESRASASRVNSGAGAGFNQNNATNRANPSDPSRNNHSSGSVCFADDEQSMSFGRTSRHTAVTSSSHSSCQVIDPHAFTNWSASNINKFDATLGTENTSDISGSYILEAESSRDTSHEATNVSGESNESLSKQPLMKHDYCRKEIKNRVEDDLCSFASSNTKSRRKANKQHDASYKDDGDDNVYFSFVSLRSPENSAFTSSSSKFNKAFLQSETSNEEETVNANDQQKASFNLFSTDQSSSANLTPAIGNESFFETPVIGDGESCSELFGNISAIEVKSEQQSLLNESPKPSKSTDNNGNDLQQEQDVSKDDSSEDLLNPISTTEETPYIKSEATEPPVKRSSFASKTPQEPIIVETVEEESDDQNSVDEKASPIPAPQPAAPKSYGRFVVTKEKSSPRQEQKIANLRTPNPKPAARVPKKKHAYVEPELTFEKVRKELNPESAFTDIIGMMSDGITNLFPEPLWPSYSRQSTPKKQYQRVEDDFASAGVDMSVEYPLENFSPVMAASVSQEELLPPHPRRVARAVAAARARGLKPPPNLTDAASLSSPIAVSKSERDNQPPFDLEEAEL